MQCKVLLVEMVHTVRWDCSERVHSVKHFRILHIFDNLLLSSVYFIAALWIIIHQLEDII